MDTLAGLVTAAQAGDLDAFGQVVERFKNMAYAVAYTMLRDVHLAEEVAQEAFIEAYICLPKLREPAAFPGWFGRIVYKRGDRLTRGKNPALLSLDAVAELRSVAPDPAAVAEVRDLQRRVQAAIDALPEAEQLPIRLFYLAGYAQQEIATIMELPLTTIKKRLFHARQRLRELMDDFVREQMQEQRPAHDAQFTRTIQFFIAIRIGDITKVRAYLDQEPALLAAHERWDEATALRYGLPIVSSFTALHRAAYNGDSALLALLLERRADANAATRSGQTPLHIAVLVDRAPVVEQLLAGGADPNCSSDLGLTPLHFAVMLQRCALAARLLEAGADSALADRYGRTPLDWARLKGFEEMIILLRSRQLA
ncbi:MAG TPA: sigma-70 family RNA polymerase sigma factor [Roseiflexaceae bacterium]|nr:sigma-70 family RNA polymerase sigma factor [Roseiflexaceae bacterium]